MKEFEDFTKLETRLIDAGLIAISLIILQVWISIGIKDIFSLISLIAFAVSLPTLVTDFIICQMPTVLYRGNKTIVLHGIIRMTGWLSAVLGVSFSIYYASWIAGVFFSLIALFCFLVYTSIWNDTRNSLHEEKKIPAEQKAKEFEKQ